MALCGWASIDERGKGRGGKVGDQTGREVKTGQWYNFGQKYVIRYKDEKMAKKHASCLKKICNGNLCGYDMDNRGSLYSELKKVRFIVDDLKVKCETDCSALQCTMAICAGAKNIQLWASGSMKDGFDGKSGFGHNSDFIILTDKKYLTSGDYLLPGDISVAPGHHVIGSIEAGSKSKNETRGKAHNSSTGKTNTSSQSIYYKKYSGPSVSIVEALKAIGVKDTSFSHRKKIAKANGIVNYEGTESQNNKLVGLLKKGKLKKA